jgi:glycosyltransferase involved in cell wall biosynthesis
LGLVTELMPKVPEGARLLVTAHPDLSKPAGNNRVWFLPEMLDATLKGIQMCDAVIYASNATHVTPFGRTAAEAMSARRPVVCERRGAMAEQVEDGKHAFMFDTPDEALEKVLYLRDHPDVSKVIAANGQLWSSWQDMNTHTGTLRGILKALGA